MNPVRNSILTITGENKGEAMSTKYIKISNGVKKNRRRIMGEQKRR